MIFLFTTTNKVGSRLIRWGLDEPASHFAPVYSICPKRTKGLIFHSDFGGFQLDWLQGYLKTVNVVKAIEPIVLSKEDEHYITQKIITKLYGKGYDIPAFIYFTYRAALRKLLTKPLPPINEWNTDDILCTGIADYLYKHMPHWFAYPVKSGDIMTPWQLSENMVASGCFRELDPVTLQAKVEVQT
jgi:hypothetical protein